jgi:hypothetical protein
MKVLVWHGVPLRQVRFVGVGALHLPAAEPSQASGSSKSSGKRPATVSLDGGDFGFATSWWAAERVEWDLGQVQRQEFEQILALGAKSLLGCADVCVMSV